MKLSDFTPSDCRNLLLNILWRYDSARERWPVWAGMRTETYLSIDEARMIWATGQWLKKYKEWDEAAGGKIGKFPAKFGLSECSKFFMDAAQDIDKDHPIIILSEKDMRKLESAARHLEHYELMIALEKNKKGNWKKR